MGLCSTKQKEEDPPPPAVDAASIKVVSITDTPTDKKAGAKSGRNMQREVSRGAKWDAERSGLTPFELVVKGVDGETMTLGGIYACDTVRMVKVALDGAGVGLQPEQQKLILDGKVLEDNAASLASVGIEGPGIVLNLVEDKNPEKRAVPKTRPKLDSEFSTTATADFACEVGSGAQADEKEPGVFSKKGFVKSKETVFAPGNGETVTVKWISGKHGPGVGVCDSGGSVAANNWSSRSTWFTMKEGTEWTNGAGDGKSGRMFLNGLSKGGGTTYHDNMVEASDALKKGDRISLTWDKDRQLVYNVNGGANMIANPKDGKCEFRDDLKELYLYLVLVGDTKVKVRRFKH